jgi:hypothetical protein
VNLLCHFGSIALDVSPAKQSHLRLRDEHSCLLTIHENHPLSFLRIEIHLQCTTHCSLQQSRHYRSIRGSQIYPGGKVSGTCNLIRNHNFPGTLFSRHDSISGISKRRGQAAEAQVVQPGRLKAAEEDHGGRFPSFFPIAKHLR